MEGRIVAIIKGRVFTAVCCCFCSGAPHKGFTADHREATKVRTKSVAGGGLLSYNRVPVCRNTHASCEWPFQAFVAKRKPVFTGKWPIALKLSDPRSSCTVFIFWDIGRPVVSAWHRFRCCFVGRRSRRPGHPVWEPEDLLIYLFIHPFMGEKKCFDQKKLRARSQPLDHCRRPLNYLFSRPMRARVCHTRSSHNRRQIWSDSHFVFVFLLRNSSPASLQFGWSPNWKVFFSVSRLELADGVAGEDRVFHERLYHRHRRCHNNTQQKQRNL